MTKGRFHHFMKPSWRPVGNSRTASQAASTSTTKDASSTPL
ncbi:Uncharacterised protein [Bordetella pertussis]|nr:Uncharacterised protein [Bordetella pertussis]